jgi:FkbM family methyltransferase
MKSLQAALGRCFGNATGQRFLDFSLRVNLWLMGIGAGSSPESSGETVLAKRLRSHREPLCILDVGANKGQFASMILSRLHDLPLTLHCFEPGSHAFEALKQAHGGDPRVVLNNVALGSEKGSRTLYFDAPGSVLASVYKRRLDFRNIAFDESETVDVATLDAYCEAMPRVHLLKLDVEGHEMDVLLGATATLERCDMVSFEFGGTNIDSRTYLRDFFFFFRDRRFRLFRIGPSGYLRALERYSEWDEQFVTTNFVAIRDLELVGPPGFEPGTKGL